MGENHNGGNRETEKPGEEEGSVRVDIPQLNTVGEDNYQDQANSDEQSSYIPTSLNEVQAIAETQEVVDIFPRAYENCNNDFTALRDSDIEQELAAHHSENEAIPQQTMQSPNLVQKTKAKRGRPRKKDKQETMSKLGFDPLGNNEVDNLGEEDEEGIEEATRTWNVGRLVMMQSSNDKEVINAIRRSQRGS